ncbi:XRE family transcriptional regulator [Erwinia rhapontici]|uniref:XRE family transcriptional regulator n=1 Tax=Erwinia rhapontici TaxID=55212 RepID=UPI003D36D8D8
MTFSERLSQAMNNAGYTQGRLAREVGMAQSSVNKLLNGASSSRKVVEIAKILGVSAEWLIQGGSAKPTSTLVDPSVGSTELNTRNTYRVDVLDVQASAGNGTQLASDFIETVHAIEYTTEQARSLFGNRSSDTVKVITVRGDSMSGTIEPGDYIFVDISINCFDGDGLYVFCYGQTIHVKRLQMVKSQLLVLSDNKLYSTWSVDKSDEDEFKILAKVLLKQSADYKRFS